ncbi:MAG: RDD family protein [Nostocoides sp.]
MTQVAQSWPGKAYGLPSSGPGSVGRVGRRLVAVAIDWFVANLIAITLLGVPIGATGGAAFVPLVVFAAENILLLSTLGWTIGMRIVSIRVGSLGRPSLSPVHVVVRTVLLCLFIPAVIWDHDGRGLHDRASGTVVVRS